MKNEYPNLHEIAMRFLLCFSITYLCETATFWLSPFCYHFNSSHN